MSHPATDQFLDGLQSNRLLDDARIDELRSRPEASWGNVDSLTKYAQDRGWLTAFQASEASAGRGDRLTIHGYRIFDKLEDGPVGITYKAIHPALMQPVWLRVVRPEWLAPTDTPAEYISRAQAASLAQSPHLANVLDAGTYEDQPFVVQEYVDGCDLFHFVNEMGAVPLALASEYVRQAALALKAAHNCGVVHGDVSPHKMLLTPVKRATSSNGDVSIRPVAGARIKLVELGLVPRRPPVGELTYGESDRLGSVAFFPPERLTNGERSTAGDVYGLGGTLYFLLTTKPPHAGNSPLEVLLNLQQAEPTPLETLKPDLPADVTDLVQRLLSRDALRRPSAAEVVELLLPYCEISAMPDSSMDEQPRVLLAYETATHPSVPTAVPVARNLDQPESELSSGPFAEDISSLPNQPTIEPLDSQHNGHALMPEIQPLDEHHSGSSEHLNAFGHSAIGTGAPRVARPRTRMTSRNKQWIMVGIGLWLFAGLLWIVFFTNVFTPSHSQDSEQKTTTTPTKPKVKKS